MALLTEQLLLPAMLSRRRAQPTPSLSDPNHTPPVTLVPSPPHVPLLPSPTNISFSAETSIKFLFEVTALPPPPPPNPPSGPVGTIWATAISVTPRNAVHLLIPLKWKPHSPYSLLQNLWYS